MSRMLPPDRYAVDRYGVTEVPDPVKRQLREIASKTVGSSSFHQQWITGIGAGAKNIRLEGTPFTFQLASRKQHPIAAGVLLEQAAVAPLLSDSVPVVRPIELQGNLICPIEYGDDVWYLTAHDNPGHVDLRLPHTQFEFDRLLDAQLSWALTTARGPVGGGTWRLTPVPFDGLDQQGSLTRISDHLPDYTTWRANHLHKQDNFHTLDDLRLTELTEIGADNEVVDLVRGNLGALQSLTRQFNRATAGTHLTNGMLNGEIAVVSQYSDDTRVRWSNFGQLTIGHPFVNFMYCAFDQLAHLMSANRSSHWPAFESHLFQRLARLEEIGVKPKGWQLRSFAATYLGQFLAGGLRALPPEFKDAKAAQREWLGVSQGAARLLERWNELPDGDLDPAWSLQHPDMSPAGQTGIRGLGNLGTCIM